MQEYNVIGVSDRQIPAFDIKYGIIHRIDLENYNRGFQQPLLACSGETKESSSLICLPFIRFDIIYSHLLCQNKIPLFHELLVGEPATTP